MSGAGTILIVDDDPLVLMNHADLLEEAGFAVTTAETLSVAKGLVGARRFDLVICDHDLSDGKGEELVVLLERDRPDTAVIYLSAAQSNVLERIGERAVVREALAKPVDGGTLLESVNRHLEVMVGEAVFHRLVGDDERLMLLNDETD